MTLTSKFDDVMLTLDCPHCGKALTKKGSWFKTASRFVCARCKRETRITYGDKIKMFGRLERLNHDTP
ncbi:hypothetical protein SAMN05519103_08789 [Rhizobiales bacterium GAS113]|nr:hypothetical protein SAMN05519103_08789 [Rhizobiales bacterium GAS113]SEF04022.1 hypothetical protein SAMN05519104_8033 [Rhizobiales bacterium GAS188]